MAETLADNSEIPATTVDNAPTMPDAPAEKAPEERPRTSRGRPKGSKDSKPRIRRVPVVIEQEEAPAKSVQFKEPTPEPEAALEAAPEPPPKSPRELHREHVQALAAERRKLALARQAHYESLLATNLSW